MKGKGGRLAILLALALTLVAAFGMTSFAADSHHYGDNEGTGNQYVYHCTDNGCKAGVKFILYGRGTQTYDPDGNAVSVKDPQYTVDGDTWKDATASVRYYDGTSWTDSSKNNVGTYTVGVDVKGGETINATFVYGSMLTIEKADIPYTAPTGSDDIKYDGSSHKLVSGGSSNILYKVKDKSGWGDDTWKEVPPSGKNVDAYVVRWTVDTTGYNMDNYNAVPKENIKVNIVKGDIETPTLEDNTLDYTGEAQQLIPEVTTDIGTPIYSVNGGEWDYEVPTGEEVGEYKVSCKIKGNENYNDSEIATATITIDDNPSIEKAPTAADESTYDGNEKELLKDEGVVHNGHFRYSVRKNGGDWSTPTSLNPPKATDAGTYEIWYCLYDNEDIKVDGKSGTVTTVIKKADDEITSLTLKDWTYGNNPSAPSATAKSGNKEITFTYSDAEGGEYGEYDDVVKGQAGTWYVKATVADSDNYNGASRVKSFRIRRLDVTVTVDNKTSKYKEEIKDLTYSYETEGTVKDDLQLPLMTEATATSEVGEYPIYVSYGQAEKATQKEIDENNPNYDITVTDGTYTIEPADMTLSLKQKTGSGSIKDFDGSYNEYYDTKEHRFAVFAYGPDEKKLPSAEAKVYYSTDPDFMEESTDFPVYKNATNGEVKVYYRVVAPNYTAPKTSGYFTVNIEKVLITVDGREYDDEDYPIETEYGTLETFNDSENYYEKYVTYTGFVGDEGIEDVDPEGSLNFTADGDRKSVV